MDDDGMTYQEARSACSAVYMAMAKDTTEEEFDGVSEILSEHYRGC